MQREILCFRAFLVLATLAAGLLPAGAAAAQEEDKDPPAQPPIVMVGAEPSPRVEALPVEAPAPEELQAPVAAAAAPEEAVLSLGFSGLVSGASIADEVEVNGMWGLDVALRLTPWLYVGARRIGTSWASSAGGRFAVGGSPVVGVGWRIGEVVELFGELGAAVQGRFGGQLEGALGVAPFGGVGARFRVAEWISLGVEGTLHVPATDTFLVDNAVLPSGAVWLAGGAGVLFHVR